MIRPGQLKIADEAGALIGYATELAADGATVVNGVARLPGLSTALYASRNGAVGDTNLLTGGGANDTAVIQDLLDHASAGDPVHVIIDRPCRVDYLDIYSNTWLEIKPGCGFYQSNGAPRAMLRNANPSGTTRTDKNIRITGGFWNGNSANQSGIGLYGTQEADGTLLGLIQMFGVENLLVEHVHLYHSKTIACFGANLLHAVFNNLRIDNKVTGQYQQGGLQIDSPSERVGVLNLRGRTQDDLFAINTDDDSWVNGSFTGLGPYIVGGAIRDVHGVNIIGEDAYSLVRFFNSVNRLDGVRIVNVGGTFDMHVFNNDPLTIGPGNVGTFIVEGVNARPTTAPFAGAAFFNVWGRMEQLILRDLNISELVDARPIIQINESADLELLDIDGLGIYEGANASAGLQPIPVSGRIQQFNGHGWKWKRSPQLPQGTDLIKTLTANAQIENLRLREVTASRVAHILNHTTGRVGNVQGEGWSVLDGLGSAGIQNASTIDEVNLNTWRGEYAVPMAGAATVKRGDAFVRDATAPTPSSYYCAYGPFVSVTFSKPVNSSNFTAGVTIKVNGVAASFAYAKRRDCDPTTVEWVLTANIPAAATVTWEYDSTAGDIQDASANPLASVSAHSITPSRTGLVYDLFEASYDTAANGRAPSPQSAGFNWGTLAGSATRQKLRGGRLSLDGGAAATVESMTVDINASDFIASAGVWIEHLPTSNSGVGLLFRASDASNYWLYWLSHNAASLFKVVAGVTTTVSSTSWRTFTRIPLGLNVRCNGTSIQADVGGLASLSATDSFNQTVKKVGIQAAESLALIDDFVAITYV